MAKGLIANGDKAFHDHLCICKPGSVNALRRISIIYLGRRSPFASIGLPSGMRLAPQGRTIHARLSADFRYTWPFSP